jgi:Tfp pilus tip-associated adhesin PilY1
VLTAADLTNIRIEFDFYMQDDPESVVGAVWNAADTGGDIVLEDAYLFFIGDIPDDTDHTDKAEYTLVKRVAGVDTVVANGRIDTSADPGWPKVDPGPAARWTTDSVNEDYCYRLRIDYYCGYVRAQVKQFNCVGAVCDESDWHTIVEWVDDFVTYGATLAPGMAGMFSGSNGTFQPVQYYDNFEIYSWGDACTGPEEPCGEWTAWAEVNRQPLRFKRLYEAAMKDYSLGDVAPQFRIDINTTAPTPGDGTTFCNGWQLLVDLPEPIIGSDLDKVRHYLENTSTAVEFLSDGAGTFQFLDNFDEDPASGTYNPVPMVADGRTPINNALFDAFDWYVEQREAGGRWAEDPLAECRKWYLVLITDGAESCEAYTRLDGTGGGFACDSGNAADKFKTPGVVGVESMPIFTIGFSEGVADAPPELKCISDITDGQYFGARNASELKDALYGVLNQLNTDEERSFTPFKVSPPPSSKGGPATEQDFLVVYPYFQAVKESSLWSGNLFGFRLNENQTTLETDADCEVDATTLVVEEVSGNTWDAAARLTDQLSAGTPERPVLMGQLVAGVWSRHDLTEIKTDAALRLYLRNHMAVPGGADDIEAHETVNFLRNIWEDDADGVDPTPRAEPRPANYPVLGDFYHSQPTVVSPPNRSMFFFDYGYGDAHGYASFMEKQAMRRRVVLAGANDGMLHAFDGGIFDRDRSSTTEAYNDQHDLGDGSELFAYVPHAVMPRLYNMTYGKSQQYLVDGLIATSDVYIDHDGDTNREWRTVAIATMRRGGRGMVALDITQPDPIDGTTFVPEVPADQFPGCLNGGTGCDGEYPKLLWEFEDFDDTDGNCPFAPGIACSPFWDLGWTWSKPAIARIAVYDASGTPDDVFVAFFGGGWDRTEADRTGNFIYGVDIETGQILYETNLGVAVPGSPTALDSDIDGFHDRIYFADSDGSVFRLQFKDPNDSAQTGADAGTLTRIFDFRATAPGGPGFSDRQQFFTRPVMVPALFTGSNYTWAMALGTGDRANLDRYDDVNNPVDHFFFMLDVGDTNTRHKNDLVAVNYDELNGDFDCTAAESPLDTSAGNYGWYLSLRPNEKVVFDASVINGHVLFPTFDPTPGEFATHNVPDECVPASAGTPTPTPTPNVAFGDEEVICKAAGIGRSYDLWFECGMGEYGENNDIYTGIEDYTIGGTTYVTFTESGFTEGETEEFPNVTGHVVTNWRQD